jgi:glycosyltransferase involved in cell wall biosynthesis
MLSWADIFAFPTLDGPYGLVVDEAIACSLPIVGTSAAGEIRDRVEKGINGYIVPLEDSLALADRMLHLVNNPELCGQMGKVSAGKSLDIPLSGGCSNLILSHAGSLTMSEAMQFQVSTPYRANSIVNIARTVALAGQLDRFYTSFYLARWQSVAQRLPLIGSRLAQELSRRAFPGIAATCVTTEASTWELLHVGSRRLFKLWPGIVDNLMYRVKARFDTAVARQLTRQPTEIFIGMYGASLESFRVVHHQDGLAVLNFVNSHPTEHNRYLMELAGLKAPHHELIPAWMAQRVELELSTADLVLVPSRFVADQLRSHGVAEEKIALIPYGVDLRAFYPRERQIDKKTPLECLYVGQISYRKGIRVLLDAARYCQNQPVNFRLVGPLVSREVLANLPDNVFYGGPSLPSSVAEKMRAADLFIFPSLEDSFALVIFEAMATGLAVITTNHAGSSERLSDGEDALIVPAGDARALAYAVQRLVEDPALRQRLGEAARRKVEGAYSWESYGQQVLQVINDRWRGKHAQSHLEM